MMEMEITNIIRLSNIPAERLKYIKASLTLANPKYIENERMGRSNRGIPKHLTCFTDKGNTLCIPRGFGLPLTRLCERQGVPYQFDDLRRVLPEVEFTFTGTLKPFQAEAVKAVMARAFGTLSAPTGSGKTVMALSLIAERRQPTLIVVHTKELLTQWINRIETFLGIPREEIGVIGAGKKQIGEKITVAMIQTLRKCAKEIAPAIGYIIVDECHRTPSKTFTEAVTAFDSLYMTGLTATPWRRDKLSRLIFWYLGDVIHEVGKKALIDNRDILPVEVEWRETAFATMLDASSDYSKVLSELTMDPERNDMICDDVVRELETATGICLVLSDRKAHCQSLGQILAEKGIKAEILTGDTKATEREEITRRLACGGVKVIVATGQLIGEGFDCPALSTLFLATPLKFSGRLIQYMGRVLRTAPGKTTGRVFDYVDVKVGVLKASAWARAYVYRGAVSSEPVLPRKGQEPFSSPQKGTLSP